MNYNIEILRINLKEIIKNDYYKISRNIRNNELAASLKNAGMLEIPYLIKSNNGYYPLTCHNRITIMQEYGFDKVESYILDFPVVDIFIRNLLIKIYRNECGPIGRVKAFTILKNDFKLEDTRLLEIAKKTLKIPHEILSDEIMIARIKNLPENVKNYLDVKDISFKIIRDIIFFDEALIDELSRWIDKIQIRQNIFKMLVDFLFDIRRRDGFFKIIENDLLENMDDKSLHDYVFKLRYPEYLLKKEKAEKIINQLSGKGVSVDFPEYFEKDSICLKFIINKKDEGSKISEFVSGLNVNQVNELLSLL